MCSRCQTCQKVARRNRARAHLVPLPLMERPYQRIGMDMIGPLPTTRDGYRYILTVVDYATRYPEATALKQTGSQMVADALMVLFARWGIPEEILTDCGSNFIGKLMNHFYMLLGIHPIRTSIYHPQTDGLVERFNQTLKAMLRKVTDRTDGDWRAAIPYVLFAYRETQQEATGFSPSELMLGRQLRGPLDTLKQSWQHDRRSRAVPSPTCSRRMDVCKPPGNSPKHTTGKQNEL